MIIVEALLNLYTFLVLTLTGSIFDMTGIYPREQLAYVQHINNLPESAGVMDTVTTMATR